MGVLKALLFDGCEVEYQPSPLQGRWYKAIAAGAPHMCGSTPVVRLRDVEPAYSRDHHPGHNRTTVAAAALSHVRIPPDCPSSSAAMCREDAIRLAGRYLDDHFGSDADQTDEDDLAALLLRVRTEWPFTSDGKKGKAT